MTRREVWFAEDDADDRELIEEAMSRVGPEYEVHFASDGQDLIKALEGSVLDRALVIFMDIRMPRMDGFETLHSLREREGPGELPVIMFSTSTSHTDVAESYRRGANAYLVKPSTFKELVDTVDTTLRFWSRVSFPRTLSFS